MTKVQFFEDTDIASLQNRINEWLAEHKAIRIINSNIGSIMMPDHLNQMPQKHVFFILYSVSAKADSLHKKTTAVNIIAETDEQGLIRLSSQVHSNPCMMFVK